MSRTTVRAAVAAYFQPPAVPGLLTMRLSKRRNWNAADFQATPPLRSAAAGYVYIAGITERRGALGKKFLTYEAAVVYEFRSWAPEADDATADFDIIADAIKARVRLDPHLGVAPEVIFNSGAALLEDASDDTIYMPREQRTLAAVRFDVSEWLNA